MVYGYTVSKYSLLMVTLYCTLVPYQCCPLSAVSVLPAPVLHIDGVVHDAGRSLAARHIHQRAVAGSCGGAVHVSGGGGPAVASTRLGLSRVRPLRPG